MFSSALFCLVFLISVAFGDHISPVSGVGSVSDPFVLAGRGETAPITIAKGKTLYYRIPADNVPMLYFVLYPCFGAVEYDVFVNKEVGDAPDHSFKWPEDTTKQNGEHLWDLHNIELNESAENFVNVVVRNVFDGDEDTVFQIDSNVDKKHVFAVEDGEIQVDAFESTGVTISWTKTTNPDDEYQVVFHQGGKDGSMMPGHLMGTYCGVQTLRKIHGESVHVKNGAHSASDDEEHDHDSHSHDHKRAEHAHGVDHKVFSLFDFQKDIDSAVLTGLRPNATYHIDVIVQRIVPGGHHPIHRAYHALVVHMHPDSSATTNALSSMTLVMVTLFALFFKQ
eukprot:TRINITY_DN1635_c0_g3_i3.p1 TRINITY_DN1635_c0_g3~~TRINITY_DN1635_c0_g3_i3.p1  ORF type:complete len:352 (-),score=35.96 TRINITY_DN1635_c0_g3_i3:51-1061(-)